MRCLGFQEKIWIAPKGKPLELMIRRCHLFQVPRDSQIEGLGGARRPGDGVRVLGVDSVTDDSSDVVGSVSGERMGEGPGKGGRTVTDLTGETGNLEDTTERLATDSGNGIFQL
jgi:hypothetical protein